MIKNGILSINVRRVHTQFGAYAVQRMEDIDGYKFYLSDDKWVMIRPSGTEPVLRVYAQGPTMKDVRSILENTHKTWANNRFR